MGSRKLRYRGGAGVARRSGLTDEPGPLRTCVGCRRIAPRHALVRFVASPDGRLTLGAKAPGRGAWLCASVVGDSATGDLGEVPNVDCLTLALRRRAFERALRKSVDLTDLRAALPG